MTSEKTRFSVAAGLAALSMTALLLSASPAAATPLAASPARAVAAAPPFVACSPEEIRATQRWWMFGSRAVVDFGVSGDTVSVALNTMTTDSSEGTTVVTDTAGELQFYSNGLTVWNRDHAVMENGSGLIAAPSATQTVAAFPSLSRPGIYFVVSNGGASESGGVGPLRYSEVDMSLDGGLGAVTSTKNVLLDGGANTATEGMTAVPNADGTGFWVITATGGSVTGNTNMVAHEFDGDGPTGTIVRSPMSTANGNQFGTLNLSSDMTRIVQHLGSSSGGAGQLRLLELDAETGEIDELVTWASPTGAGLGSNAYSADFSPDGRWVYATRIFGGGKLLRYDVETYTTAAELEANVEVIGDIGTFGGQVKRAPDGKMYVASYGATSLGVVNDPDDLDDPDYVAGGLALAVGSTVRFGLPQTATGCPVPLTAPSNLTVASAGYDALDLAWSAPVDDDGDTLVGYRIERSLDGSTWSVVVANTGSTSLTYTDTGLDPATEYSYRVFAVFSGSTSGSSNVAKGTTGSEAPECADDHVDCYPSPVTGHDVVLELDPVCEVQSATSTPASALAATDPAPFDYPVGLLEFVADCGTPGFTTTVTQLYFDTVDDDFVVRKHLPATAEFRTISDAVVLETTVNGRAVLKVSFEVTDGGPLDADGLADGVITDPAGPANSTVGAPRTGAGPTAPAALPWVAIVLGSAMLAAAFVVGRRRLRRS